MDQCQKNTMHAVAHIGLVVPLESAVGSWVAGSLPVRAPDAHCRSSCVEAGCQDMREAAGGSDGGSVGAVRTKYLSHAPSSSTVESRRGIPSSPKTDPEVDRTAGKALALGRRGGGDVAAAAVGNDHALERKAPDHDGDGQARGDATPGWDEPEAVVGGYERAEEEEGSSSNYEGAATMGRLREDQTSTTMRDGDAAGGLEVLAP
ncbi:unnamed protein product [Clonostachys rosea]|uniref:Uncharacterized protein n=1 Tax=Bionectria ochroleuca TaxID=29856 RepID=A0ABY6V2S8_BIOOC|nr:unnamed protein product [Clonostachys rosea]